MGVGFVVAGAVWLYWRGQWSWWGLWTAVIGTGSSVASKWVIAESGWAPHACFSFLVGASSLTLAGMFGNHMKPSALGQNLFRNRLLILYSAIATVCFYSALNLAPLNRVSPLVRVNLIVGFALSVWMLRERDRLKSRAFGAFLILLGIVLVVWRA